jgi:hypothetical protein
MKQKSKEILLKNDEIGRYETPSSFNYNKLKNQVSQLVSELHKSFGLTFVIDDQIQDASFFCDIVIPNDLVINPKTHTNYSIRISNFGALATLSYPEKYSIKTVLLIKNILTKFNFVFIDGDDLEQNYDGGFMKFYEILGPGE